MSNYARRPEPSGLHAKLLSELSATNGYYVSTGRTGLPNHIVIRWNVTGPERFRTMWWGHRDRMPACYRGASDPYGLLSRPASD